jgi:GT2 family glycosyltransferase
MNAAPTISVIIVAYNSGPTLERCLSALKAQTFTDYEVLLVDNAEPGTGDGAPQRAAAADAAVRLIEPGANTGFAGGNNLAARQAAGRWLVLLNPDAYADPDWLQMLVEASQRWPERKAFTSRQLMEGSPGTLDGMGDVMFGAGIPYRGGYGRPDEGGWIEGDVFSPCGAAMMVDRALFLSLGGFDERFFCYCEDVDLGFRLQLIGEKTLVVPSAVVRHEGSASSGGPSSDFAVYHGTRNRLWMLVKDVPGPMLWPVLILHYLAIGTQIFIARRSPAAQRTLTAMVRATRHLDTAWKARRAVQATRKVSWMAIARAMTWNPRDVTRMRPDIRPPQQPVRTGSPLA